MTKKSEELTVKEYRALRLALMEALNAAVREKVAAFALEHDVFVQDATVWVSQNADGLQVRSTVSIPL